MNDEVQALITLGERVLKDEIHISDISYPSTVSGPQCDEWKKKCSIFFKSFNGREFSEGYKLANIKILKKSQASRLLDILKNLQDQDD